MPKEIEQSITEITKVAEETEKKHPRVAFNLKAVTEELKNIRMAQSAPVAEPVFNPYEESEQSLSTNDLTHPLSSEFTQIEQFAKPDNQQVMVIHNLTVGFKAPKDTSKTDILNAIMQTVEQMGVTVDHFAWSGKPERTR